jgi:hypothetical protein
VGSLRLLSSLAYDDDNVLREFQSVKELVPGAALHHQEGEVPTTTVVKFYDAAEDIATWSCLRIDSLRHRGDGTVAQDLVVELTVDVDGSTGTELLTLGLPAGATLQLPSQQAYAGYVENFGGGTIGAPDGLIQRVRVYNPGATKAWCRVIAT